MRPPPPSPPSRSATSALDGARPPSPVCHGEKVVADTSAAAATPNTVPCRKPRAHGAAHQAQTDGIHTSKKKKTKRVPAGGGREFTTAPAQPYKENDKQEENVSHPQGACRTTKSTRHPSAGPTNIGGGQGSHRAGRHLPPCQCHPSLAPCTAPNLAPSHAHRHGCAPAGVAATGTAAAPWPAAVGAQTAARRRCRSAYTGA